MRLKHYSQNPMRFKFAAMPMGDLQLMQLQTATGDDGRARLRTIDNPQQQVSNAFDQNQIRLMGDGYNESNQFSVGSDQSKVAVAVQDIVQHSHVPIKTHPAAEAYGGGFYDSKNDFIGSPKKRNVNTLAHELGHAQLQQSLLGKILHNRFFRITHELSPLIGVAGGLAMSGTPKQRAIKSLLLGLGLSAPTLASEGIATYKGYKTLKHLGANDKEIDNYTKHLALPQLSYLLNPLAAAGASFGISSKYGAAHKLARRMKFRDFDVSIETDKGQYRHWYDANAKKEGKTLMQYPYGYIRGTKGMDGDHVDCFIGPDEKASNVYVIMTNKAPNFNSLDEQKCMLGFSSAAEAKRVFLAHYTNPKFFNSMTTLPYEEFRDKVYRTLHSKNKKVASMATFDDIHNWSRNSQGPFHDQTPGDYLGFPASSLVGLRRVEGDPMTPADKVDRQFRFHDMDMNTRVLEGNEAAAPASPGV